MKFMQTLRVLLIFLIVIYLCGCRLNVTIHDEENAAIRAKTILENVLFEVNAKGVYIASSDELKEAVVYSDFEYAVDYVAYGFSHANVTLDGYEIYGSKELITIYASSNTQEGDFYFALTFNGSKLKGYSLESLRFTNDEIPKNGVYKDFSNPILAGLSQQLIREIKLKNGDVITIDGVTKTFIESDNIYVYTLTYLTELDLNNHKEIEEQASRALAEFGGKKAISSGLLNAAMVAANESRVKKPQKEISVYRTVYKFSEGQWVRW